jgi:hypothetical protein
MQDTSTRRWTRRRKFTLSDVAAWFAFTFLTAAILLALCVMLAILWPTP